MPLYLSSSVLVLLESWTYEEKGIGGHGEENETDMGHMPNYLQAENGSSPGPAAKRDQGYSSTSIPTRWTNGSQVSGIKLLRC